MALTELLSVGNYFVQFVILAIVIGILILEYINRRPNKRKGILLYLVVFILGMIISIFDATLTFNPYQFSLISPMIGITLVSAIIIFIINSIKVWKHIDKFLFFSASFFAITTLILKIISSVTIESRYDYEIFVTLAYLMTIISGYFFIIKFLISSKEKIK